MTTSRSRGISTSMFLRLCPRAPRMTMLPAISVLPLVADLLPRRGHGALENGAVFGEVLAGIGLEAHHQRGLRVGRAQQSPSVREPNARAIEIDDVVPGGSETVAHAIGDAELEIVGAVDSDLRRGRRGRQIGQQVAYRPAAASQDLEEASAGVDAVIEAEPALTEENVPAHLATEKRAGLAHLRFEQ